MNTTFEKKADRRWIWNSPKWYHEDQYLLDPNEKARHRHIN